MIGPSLSMVMYQRLSPGILPLLLEASSHWLTIKMQTCTMTYYRSLRHWHPALNEQDAFRMVL
jgi:hypothetical protein